MRKFTIALAVTVAACGSGSVRESGVGQTEQKVINGIDSTADQDAVVQLFYYERNSRGIGGCTATMLSPRIALTARHCVSSTDEQASCDSQGNVLAGGRIMSDHPASAMYVMLGVSPSFRGRADGQGKELYLPESKVMCNSDIAVIELATPVTNAKIAPIRLDSLPVKGELITAIGWGLTENGQNPSRRQQRTGIEVLDVGPVDRSNRGGLGANEFEVGESICSGDSGGPAIAESTGAIIGVVSRGGNGSKSESDPSVGCKGLGTHNTYTSVAPYKDLIMQAFASTGEEPWFEGGPDPRKAKADATCTTDDECRSGKCLDGVCVDPCGSGGTCADGHTCKNDVGFCVLGTTTDISATNPGGCSTTNNGSDASSASGLSLVAACAMVLAGLRRRKVK